jgi:hypothetical protein
MKARRHLTLVAVSAQSPTPRLSTRGARPKRRIVLRELKETSFRLRVLRNAGILTPAHDPLITECGELVKIVATLIRKSKPI